MADYVTETLAWMRDHNPGTFYAHFGDYMFDRLIDNQEEEDDGEARS